MRKKITVHLSHNDQLQLEAICNHIRGDGNTATASSVIGAMINGCFQAMYEAAAKDVVKDEEPAVAP